MDITISIVSYNTSVLLEKCITSIQKYTKNVSYEIIVVDNNSTDNTRQMLAKNFPKVQLIKNSKNNFYSKANNQALKKARGKYFLILNADTYFTDNSIKKIFDYLETHKNVGAVEGLEIYENGKLLPNGSRDVTPLIDFYALSILGKKFRGRKKLKWYRYLNKDRSKTFEVEVGCDAFLAVRTHILKKIEGYDEKLLLYYTENDLCIRIRKLGYTVIHLGNTHVYHKVSVSANKLKWKKLDLYYNDLHYYYTKNGYKISGTLLYMLLKVEQVALRVFRPNMFDADSDKISKSQKEPKQKTSRLSASWRIAQKIFLPIILISAFFLRVYKLDTFMPFIPDQGWFYLSVRDMLTTGNIPLVGPPTSHPWIHHGALWTYTLAALLFLGKFNPVFPAYYIAVLGVLTTLLMYYVGSKAFSRTVGLVSAFLWATSPLIILNSRIPYHTSPIPFFVIILFYLTYLWVKGYVKVFPVILFLLAVLYNHEITTFVFDITIGAILLYGILKKKSWSIRLLDRKIIFLSIVLFIIPMFPFLLYDTNHGYKQTLGFGVWVLYRLIKIPLNVIHPSASSVASPTLSASLPEFFSYFQQLIFIPSLIASLLILFASIGSALSQLIKRKASKGLGLLMLFLGVAIPGLFLHRVPIEADTLLISPFVIILIALMLERLFKVTYLRMFLILVIILIGMINAYSLLSSQYLTKGAHGRLTIKKQMDASTRVISIAGKHRYNIKGKGELSNFPVFTMPYEYILWWKGSPPSHMKEKIQIEIWEKGDKILVEKKK